MEIEMDEFHALQRQIIDLQDCCSEWEKQALDYKAELTKTKQALDVARHTIGWINQMIDEHTDKQAIKIKCEYALDQIKPITETKE